MRFALLLSLLALPLVAFAQDVDPGQAIGALVAAFQGKAWIAAIGAASTVLVYVLRHYIVKVSWFQTDRGGVVLNFAVAFLLALGQGVVSNHIDWGIVVNGFFGAVISAGLFTKALSVFSPDKEGDAAKVAALQAARAAAKAGVAVALLLTFAGAARAQDVPVAEPAPSAAPQIVTIPQLPKISVDLGGGWSLQGGIGAGGSALAQVRGDDGRLHWQVVRNVQLAGLLEVGTPWSWADPVIGPAWQTGTAQGWGATFGGVEKKTGMSLTVLASPIWVGGRATWSIVGGTVYRY